MGHSDSLALGNDRLQSRVGGAEGTQDRTYSKKLKFRTQERVFFPLRTFGRLGDNLISTSDTRVEGWFSVPQELAWG